MIGQSSNQAHLDVEAGEEPVDETSYVSPETLRRLMLRYDTADVCHFRRAGTSYTRRTASAAGIGAIQPSYYEQQEIPK